MNKRTLYAFLISFVLLVLAIFINQRSFNSMKEYTASVTHSREIITSLERLSNYLKSAQIYSPRYSHIAEKEFYNLYRDEAINVTYELMRLETLCRKDSLQTRYIDSLEKLIYAQLHSLLNNNIVELINNHQSYRLAQLFDIHSRINASINHEKQSLNRLDAELVTSTELTNLLTLFFSVIAIVIIILTFIFNVILARKGKWLEGFLESVLNTSQNGIISYRAIRKQGKIVDFRIQYANKAIEHLLKLKPEEVIGKRLSDIQAFVLQSDLFQKYVSVVETGAQLEFEQHYERDGLDVWFYMMLAKLEDGITASFNNITNIKKSEVELRNNIARLENSDGC